MIDHQFIDDFEQSAMREKGRSKENRRKKIWMKKEKLYKWKKRKKKKEVKKI